MAHQLEFERVVSYDPGLPGITLPAQLNLKEQTIDVQVKVDTGATSWAALAGSIAWCWA